MLAFILRGYRWSLTLNRLIKINTNNIIEIYSLGAVIDFIIPIRIAELVKGKLVKDKYNISISRSFITIIIDRLFDLTPLLIIISFLPFSGIKINSLIYYFIFTISFILIFGVLFVTLLMVKIFNLVKLRKKYTHKRILNKIIVILLHFAISAHRLKLSPTLIIKLFLISILAVLSNVATFYFALKAFGSTIPIGVIIFGYIMIFLSYAVPSPPAQIGSNELFAVIIFSGIFGYNKEFISAVVLFFHSFGILFMIILAIFLFNRNFSIIKEIFKKRIFSKN